MAEYRIAYIATSTVYFIEDEDPHIPADLDTEEEESHVKEYALWRGTRMPDAVEINQAREAIPDTEAVMAELGHEVLLAVQDRTDYYREIGHILVIQKWDRSTKGWEDRRVVKMDN